MPCVAFRDCEQRWNARDGVPYSMALLGEIPGILKISGIRPNRDSPCDFKSAGTGVSDLAVVHLGVVVGEQRNLIAGLYFQSQSQQCPIAAKVCPGDDEAGSCGCVESCIDRGVNEPEGLRSY
jgi:hypothetical protein